MQKQVERRFLVTIVSEERPEVEHRGKQAMTEQRSQRNATYHAECRSKRKRNYESGLRSSGHNAPPRAKLVDRLITE